MGSAAVSRDSSDGSLPSQPRARSGSPSSRKAGKGKPPASPRTADQYARMFDRALAARYVAELRARARAAGFPDVPLGALLARADQDSVSDGRVPVLIPRMDMHECVVDSMSAGSSRKVTATLELPGMKREAVRLELRNGQLVVEGDRRPPAHAHCSSRRSSTRRSPDNLTGPGVPPPNDSRVDYLEESCRAAVAEMRYGRFRRVLTVPPSVDASQIQANMEDGILTISWPIPSHGSRL